MTTSESALVPVEIIDVRRRLETNQPIRAVCVLGEQDGDRRLYIWVGPAEGLSIASLWLKKEWRRPPAATFMANLVRATGYRVQQIVVNKLADRTFYAEVSIRNRGASRLVDARPSDAIALALASDAPIFVNADVFEAAASDESHLRSPGALEEMQDASAWVASFEAEMQAQLQSRSQR